MAGLLLREPHTRSLRSALTDLQLAYHGRAEVDAESNVRRHVAP